MTLHNDALPSSNGGQGGSVPVGDPVCVGARHSGTTAEQPEASQHAHQSTNSTGGIEAAMVAAGVFLLSSRARWAIAEDLAKEGMQPADVERLMAWLAASEPTERLQRRYLAGLLSNPPDALEALKTLDRHAETKTNHGDRNTMSGGIGPIEGEDVEQYQRERNAHIVFGRIHGDGADVATVADEMGLACDAVQKLYTLGVQLFGGGC